MQHKQLKTMVMTEVWPDIFHDGYIHQFQPEPTQNSLAAAEATSLRKNSFLYLLRHSVTVIKCIKWKKHVDGRGNSIKL